MKKNIRWIAFLPPFILLLAAIIINLINEDLLINIFSTLNNLFMDQLGWVASITTMACFLLMIIAMFSKFGNVRLGGKDAKPTISTFSWFTISLTSSLASGLLIWGIAEPAYHLADPASALTGIEPMSGAAAKFAMETMYLHWTFLPYAIYTITAVVFGFLVYNARYEYSVSTQLAPMLGKANTPVTREIVDALLLFCIGVSMAAMFGQGLVNLVGCTNALFGTANNNYMLFLFTVIFSAIAIITAISGVQKGVKLCANINVYCYIFILAFILFLGPTKYILGLGTEAIGGFATHFFERAMYTGTASGNNWPQSWTTFYWAAWMAWGPTTGMFLASISYGRKIKDIIKLNVLGCGAACVIWMTIISGAAIYCQMNGLADIIGAINEGGLGAAPYVVLKTLPVNKVLLVVYFVVIILTLVTAVNANVIAMSGLSCKKAQREDGTDITPWYMKLLWGVVVAAMAYISMALLGGYDGVKTMSNIGGIVAVFLMLGVAISCAILLVRYKQYDQTDKEITDAQADSAD